VGDHLASGHTGGCDIVLERGLVLLHGWVWRSWIWMPQSHSACSLVCHLLAALHAVKVVGVLVNDCDCSPILGVAAASVTCP